MIKDTLSMVRNIPAISLASISKTVSELYGIKGIFSQLNSERDQCHRIDTEKGDSFVLKVSNADEPEGVVDLQVKALAHIFQVDPELPVPRMVPTLQGRSYEKIEGDDGTTHIIRLLTFLPGNVLQDVYGESENKTKLRVNLGVFTARLGLALRNFFHPFASSNVHLWDMGNVVKLRSCISNIDNQAVQQMCHDVLDYAQSHVYPKLANTRHQVIHQDAHQGNVLVGPSNASGITGIIDFGDMLYGSIVSDIAVAADCYLENETDPLQVLCDVVCGYDSSHSLEENEIDLVYDMSLLRLVNTVIIINARSHEAHDEGIHLANTGKHARMLALMLEVGREEGIRRLRAACRFPVPSIIRDENHLDKLIAKRQHFLGDIWHFYQKPINIVRGKGAWLYDANNKMYLDAYNNVPQLGHSHPHVVKSLSRQAAALNTNTRYVCDIVADYAERLLGTLPQQFDVCIFVNSGSEANDVAAQLARFASGNTGCIVMEDAYHGVTSATVELSPLSSPAPKEHVERLQIPDMYRGEYATNINAAEKYAQDCDRAITALHERGHDPAFFMVDTALCSNGIPKVPKTYFEQVAQKVKRAGGLVISDEVQAGLGRLGDMWGFNAQGLHSVDFITLGKPVGNGHPLGVVITNKQLWEPFNQQCELFSTFGGNAVSCAAGMAVLDVIDREELISKSNTLGDYFRQQLIQLGHQHELIADVRGKGMLIAIEFVECRVNKTPAARITTRIVELMKEDGILVSSSGKYKNILKLRPSFAWQASEVDLFISALDKVLNFVGKTNNAEGVMVCR